MREEARKIIALFTPLLLHQAVLLAAALLLRVCADRRGLEYDAALAVLAGNLLVLPFAARMYRRDSRSMQTADREPDVRSEAGPAAGRRSDGGKRFRMSAIRGAERPLFFGLCCFLGGGALNVAWSSVLNLLRVQEMFPSQTQEQLLSSGWAVQIFGLGLAVPAAEELIFRGLTYRRMRRLFSVRIAAVFSALLFALYHGDIVQILFAFPLAVVLALVYEHGKLFVFPVLFHMGSNLTAILIKTISSAGT